MSTSFTSDLVTRPAMRMVVLPAMAIIAVLLPIPIVFSYSEWSDTAWRIGLLIGGCYVGYQAIARFTTRYTVSSLEVAVTEGILSQVTHSAPLNRITNLKLDRPFIKRIFGLADLLIDTPGGDEIEIQMTEMTLVEARRYMASIQEYLGRQKIVEAGDDAALRDQRRQTLESYKNEER